MMYVYQPPGVLGIMSIMKALQCILTSYIVPVLLAAVRLQSEQIWVQTIIKCSTKWVRKDFAYLSAGLCLKQVLRINIPLVKWIVFAVFRR